MTCNTRWESANGQKMRRQYMKARLVPVYFESARDKEFDEQVIRLKEQLTEEAEILEPVALGSPIPEADAVVFPQLVGEAYREIKEIEKITLPILAITSEFGTVAMWDWEIVTYLRSRGLNAFTPYNLELTKTICRTLGVKREMKTTKFLVFQDNPGDGMQASIFKRFFWWEDECTTRIKEKFGVEIIKKSFKKLAEDAKSIPDSDAEEVLKNWKFNTEGVSQKSLNSAIKMYIAIKREIEKDGNIKGVGMNCLNESFYSDTTPCLAWNMLFEEKGIIWACEGDTLSLLTKYILYKSLKAPVLMSNVYPFLMGWAALQHEKIQEFPEVPEPENHLLIAHCGYFACVPRVFCTEWTLRPRALEIVDENAIAIDARIPTGNVTLAEMHPTLGRMLVINGDLEGYAQYPGSDCRNGALIKVRDGHRLMNSLYSHHNCIITGDKHIEIETMCKLLGLDFENV